MHVDNGPSQCPEYPTLCLQPNKSVACSLSLFVTLAWCRTLKFFMVMKLCGLFQVMTRSSLIEHNDIIVYQIVTWF